MYVFANERGLTLRRKPLLHIRNGKENKSHIRQKDPHHSRGGRGSHQYPRALKKPERKERERVRGRVSEPRARRGHHPAAARRGARGRGAGARGSGVGRRAGRAASVSGARPPARRYLAARPRQRLRGLRDHCPPCTPRRLAERGWAGGARRTRRARGAATFPLMAAMMPLTLCAPGGPAPARTRARGPRRRAAPRLLCGSPGGGGGSGSL